MHYFACSKQFLDECSTLFYSDTALTCYVNNVMFRRTWKEIQLEGRRTFNIILSEGGDGGEFEDGQYLL